MQLETTKTAQQLPQHSSIDELKEHLINALGVIDDIKIDFIEFNKELLSDMEEMIIEIEIELKRALFWIGESNEDPEDELFPNVAPCLEEAKDGTYKGIKKIKKYISRNSLLRETPFNIQVEAVEEYIDQASTWIKSYGA